MRSSIATNPLWTTETVDALRDAASAANGAHVAALNGGGYQSGHGDEVQVADPVEITHDTLAVNYTAAAELLEFHLEGGIELEHSAGWARFVNRAIETAGLE